MEKTEPMSAERLAEIALIESYKDTRGYVPVRNQLALRDVLAHIGVLTRALEFYAVGHDGGEIARTALGKEGK